MIAAKQVTSSKLEANDSCADTSFSSLARSSSNTLRLSRQCSIKRSSSSLHLEGLSSSSFPKSSSFGSQSSVNCSLQDKELLSRGEQSIIDDALPASPSPEESRGKALVQFLLLLAIAMQLPRFLDEILKIHYGFHAAFVLLLGVIPHAFLSAEQDNGLGSGTGFLPPVFRNKIISSNVMSSPTSSLADLQELYNSQDFTIVDREESKLTTVAEGETASVSDATDGWGQFAEFDETFYENDVDASFILSANSSSSKSNLCTLPESEEEED